MDVSLGTRIIQLRQRVVSNVNRSDGEAIGLLTGHSDLIDNHPRLLRSFDWRHADYEEYEGNALSVLRAIVERDNSAVSIIEGYIDLQYPGSGAEDESFYRQQDIETFVTSAKGETGTATFTEWAGGERVTLAIVFTDAVGSTALGEEIRDEAMTGVRRAYFAESRRQIDRFGGREIKTLGDGFMAAFKSVDVALDYARALQSNTGHPQVQIRAGIHIGPMHVEAGDVFGGTVNFAARVVGSINGAEIWLSEGAKGDVDRLGASRHQGLQWERHEKVAMKGLAGVFTLWSMQETGELTKP